MKLNQFLLLKLMEECSEVSQRASKQIQFGALEVQNTQSLKAEKTNAERLKQELLDLVSMVLLLQDAKEIPEVTDDEIEQAFVAKKQKLNKYLELSESLGQITGLRV